MPPRREGGLRARLVRSFINGLILLGPAALTVYIVWVVLRTVDGWLKIPIPGLGLLVTLAAVTLFGFLASNYLASSALKLVEHTLERLPFVRLLYTAIKDVLGAFVGETRRFDKPVWVRLSAGSDVRLLGFLTQESVHRFGLDGHVAVYLPQSYNFAGQTIVVPAAHVTPVTAPSSEVMAFIVSGGVSTLPSGSTVDEVAAGPGATG